MREMAFLTLKVKWHGEIRGGSFYESLFGMRFRRPAFTARIYRLGLVKGREI